MIMSPPKVGSLLRQERSFHCKFRTAIVTTGGQSLDNQDLPAGVHRIYSNECNSNFIGFKHLITSIDIRVAAGLGP
jgi:hypothetical protein